MTAFSPVAHTVVFLEHLLDLVGMPIVAVDADGAMLYANRAAEALPSQGLLSDQCDWGDGFKRLASALHPADAAASPPFAWRSVPGIELFEAVGICAYVEVCDLQVLEHTRTPVYAVKLDRRLVQRRMGVDTHRFGAARVALTNRHGLTKEEARVALLVAERRTNREISAALHKSLHTVRHQVETMMLKLGVESRLKVYEALMASSSPVDGNVPGHRKRCLGAE